MKTETTYIIIDLRHLLESFSKCGKMYLLYNQIPLKHIVEIILKHSVGLDFEMIKTELTQNVKNHHFTEEEIEIFVEVLAHHLDCRLLEMINDFVVVKEFIFEKWIDSTSVILKWN